jgi:hypothetical protein
MVTFTPPSTLSSGKAVPICTRSGELHGRSGHYDKKKDNVRIGLNVTLRSVRATTVAVEKP